VKYHAKIMAMTSINQQLTNAWWWANLKVRGSLRKLLQVTSLLVITSTKAETAGMEKTERDFLLIF
jgi:hypothetical protein